MIEKDFKVLNDYFMRYLLAKEDSQNILKDLINSVRIDAGQESFEEVTILNTFNLKESINGKETIVDVRAKTKSGETVIIEIQRVGNKAFIYRGLYYWAKSYTANLKAKNKYEDLNPVISINILDFNLTENKDKPHSCYFIKEYDTNEILTNHFEMHFLELKKFNEKSNLYEPLADWFKFLNIKKDLEDTMKVLVEKNPIMKEIYDKYNKFVKNDDLTEGYTEWEENYFRMLTLSEERLQGKLEGIKTGEENKAISIAKTLKQMNMDDASISKATGLSVEEIRELRPDGKKL
ncbi:Rpn family recombination-promoting nuclease/putative transposase [Brachyspira sp.]|uniref:Rpn family recombination-promoting nuclease/putative transposase n=1 Tax=Brachyspira sp. TaxID=1977261 RepID=UPI003D7EE059